MLQEFFDHVQSDVSTLHHEFLAGWNWQRANLEGLIEPPTFNWYCGEIARRSQLRRSRSFTSVVMLSSPRSGSHALRGLIEMLTQRPTLGDGDSERFRKPQWLADRPVFLRADLGIPMISNSPVAVKRHSMWDSPGERLIFLVRDPVHAVVSHTRDMIDEQFSREFPSHVQSWAENVRSYQAWECHQRILLTYPDLITNTDLAAAELLRFLDIRPTTVAEKNFQTVGLTPSLKIPSVRGSLSVQSPDIYERQFKQRCESVADFIEDQGLRDLVTSVLPDWSPSK